MKIILNGFKIKRNKFWYFSFRIEEKERKNGEKNEGEDEEEEKRKEMMNDE